MEGDFTSPATFHFMGPLFRVRPGCGKCGLANFLTAPDTLGNAQSTVGKGFVLFLSETRSPSQSLTM